MRARAGILLAALATGIVAVPSLAGAEQTRSQRFFAEKLLEDRRTTERVKDLLRSGGFVERNITFEDLTRDEREDAVVRVSSGGAAGVVAVYVFSTAGGGELEAIFRSQRLTRASTRVRKGRLRFRHAVYAPGDELCCPSRIDETRTRWAPKKDRIVVRGRRTVFPEPTPTPTASP